MKGGEPTFAAYRPKVCNADEAVFRRVVNKGLLFAAENRPVNTRT